MILVLFGSLVRISPYRDRGSAIVPGPLFRRPVGLSSCLFSRKRAPMRCKTLSFGIFAKGRNLDFRQPFVTRRASPDGRHTWTRTPLAYLAGHSDFSTTKRSVHPQADTVRSAMERAHEARGIHSFDHSPKKGTDNENGSDEPKGFK